jgi:CDP-glycerol glycerophosphotransferase
VIFFVPDLDDYLHTRGVLYDYGPTAPGPQLTTTADVGAALLDLETVTARYAAARRTFNERFNTLNDGHATERVVDAFFR